MAKITRAELRKLISESFMHPDHEVTRAGRPHPVPQKLQEIVTDISRVIEGLKVVGDNPELLEACIEFYNKSPEPSAPVTLDPWDGSYSKFNIITPDGKTLNSGLGPLTARHILAGAVDIRRLRNMSFYSEMFRAI